MSPNLSIENNINKARRAFFGLGSLGIFHGKQNPLTSSEVFEVCVLSVCLYGCENWLLTEPLLLTLEAFQAEIGRRILNLPKHHSNLIPLIAMANYEVSHSHTKIEFPPSTHEVSAIYNQC